MELSTNEVVFGVGLSASELKMLLNEDSLDAFRSMSKELTLTLLFHSKRIAFPRFRSRSGLRTLNEIGAGRRAES